ncbi:hypothetical protein RRF57_001852 [Xylaria bambusicola]|uniref:Uncharacterized protein n=1 Tax=Xylaria bambusicola TaxID=326684 RepID=A0AAN7Z1Y0_9PEZI
MAVTCDNLPPFLEDGHYICSGQSQHQQSDTPKWQVGDIAFLKPYEQFTESEHKESSRVHSKATNHPVIILDRSSDLQRYTVTTVSAYSSSVNNNYLPPWAQICHRTKDIDSFRAFYGSEKPNGNSRHLHLAGGKMWPKSRTSWVYIHHWSVVPGSALIKYDKPRCQLRMAPESLQDLLVDIKMKSPGYQSRWTASKPIRMCFISTEKKVKMDRSWWRDVKEYSPKLSRYELGFANSVDRNRRLLSGDMDQRFNTIGSKYPRSVLAPKSPNTAAKRQAYGNPFSLLADYNQECPVYLQP